MMKAVLPLAAALLLPAVGRAAPPKTDLREFQVGMPVSALPPTGYGDFACTNDPSMKLSGWGDYKTCPASPDGTHAVSFRYDAPAAGGEGDKTRVGGQPVNLALLIDNDAQVSGLKIDTDPHARLYLHKKAYLFALEARARFGEDGWTCRKADPTPTEQPIGEVFINEHCEKRTDTRHFVIDRQLFRDPAKDLRDFTDATQLTILRAQ
ncbi:hypothetical protein [Rhodopila sp.]|uniref:hypothetical protein n=1 Tax=Rhodopila sp. TaxID=2480087 RepID=UPI003D0B50F9